MAGPKTMNVDQILLVLLDFFGGTIPGRLYLEKLSFLSVYEIPELEFLKESFDFKPNKFGMYSKNVLKAMEKLEEENLVLSKTYSSDAHNKEIFTLTLEGRGKAKEILEQIDRNVKVTLSNLCKGAKQLGYSGILRYTYSKYPQFTSKSEIAENVFSSYDFKE
jgi:hypothetical protein